MILGDMVGTADESPASNAAGQGVTYALENRQLIGQRTGTACDPRAIVGGEPRSRMGSHGHPMATGMKELVSICPGQSARN